MEQIFRVVKRTYPENPDWGKRTGAYTIMTNIAIRVIKEGRENKTEPSDGDSLSIAIRQAI